MKKIIIVLFSILTFLTACNATSATPKEIIPTLTNEESAGLAVYFKNCASCHANKTNIVIVGPSLAGIATRSQSLDQSMDVQQFIEQSILKPDAILTDGFDDLMPKTFGKNLTSEEFNLLVTYLLSLK